MPQKKVDSRVRHLIENGVKTKHRTIITLVGDRGRDQVANLHYILSKSQVKARPSVLWCYKKDLGFSANRKKRIKKIQQLKTKGLWNSDKDDPFELFIASTQVRWTYYKDSHKILGQTFGMCVLQDFEALTPNLLCRTIETVEGGGVVVLLLRTMSSLRQLYSMSMDVHSRFQTDAHKDVVPRFNERFILSLMTCPTSLILDDELNVLPLAKHTKSIAAVKEEEIPKDEGAEELASLKQQLADTPLVGSLVEKAKTLDQAKAVLSCAEAIAEKTLRSTVAITAGRGRGKSAALGLAMAAAIGYGYSNIFVTAPSPENLKTVFEFIFKGFEALSYQEHTDYEVVASTNPEHKDAIVRVNVFRDHRQTIQYIEPQDAAKLSQAELVVIDEAAAIPLPVVKKLLGPYLVFMSSTINGYEGTGRALSLKLIQQLRRSQMQSMASDAGKGTYKYRPGQRGPGGVKVEANVHGSTDSAAVARTLREITLAEPIRYQKGDPVEAWLNDLLCLDATKPYRLTGSLPAPKDCDLYLVDRDALFSYHKMSEAFLQRLMSLFVASHYKNSPNDLQLMSDAPAHRIFTLLGPVDMAAAGEGKLPDILCAVQVCLEGEMDKANLDTAFKRGFRSSGDLIPWSISQQFQDTEFASLAGARVVRIAVHPDAMRMGYGTRALQLLSDFYDGKIVSLDEDMKGAIEPAPASATPIPKESVLLTEELKPRKKLPPLMVALQDCKPERLQWLGVSFGLTADLFKFWNRAAFVPLYVRQTANELTGEHTVIMLRSFETSGLITPRGDALEPNWLRGYVGDFCRRFISLLGFEFRELSTTLALSVLDATAPLMATLNEEAAKVNEGGRNWSTRVIGGPLTPIELALLLTPHDIRRLEVYGRNMVDYHLIVDLLPTIARLWFTQRLTEVNLSRLQMAVLICLGLQHKNVDDLATEFRLPSTQVLALFNKAVRKLVTAMNKIQEQEVAQDFDTAREKGEKALKKLSGRKSLKESMDSELSKEGEKINKKMHKANLDLIKSLDLDEYVVDGKEVDEAIARSSKASAVPSSLSVKKRGKVTYEEAEKEAQQLPDSAAAALKEGKKKKKGKRKSEEGEAPGKRQKVSKKSKKKKDKK